MLGRAVSCRSREPFWNLSEISRSFCNRLLLMSSQGYGREHRLWRDAGVKLGQAEVQTEITLHRLANE
jgi:hypothetical protein